jgi:hypothetical protein
VGSETAIGFLEEHSDSPAEFGEFRISNLSPHNHSTPTYYDENFVHFKQRI